MSRRSVVVVGAGMGGLGAALRLARAGFGVRVLEARSSPGGLASGFEAEGFRFDGGPYVLLDRPGLEWAFRELGLALADHLELRRLDPAYEVTWDDSPPVRFRASLDATAEGLERTWPGSAARYVAYVRSMAAVYRRLQPLLRVARPGPWSLLRAGALRDVLFLLRPLGAILARAGLPRPVMDALAIWTHVAGQGLEEAPSLLALVPALIHEVGAFYPVGGLGGLPSALARAASSAGVEIECGARVSRIVMRDGRVAGVETGDERFIAADAVVSNAGGPATYLVLARGTSAGAAESVSDLPLQSPGVCAYVAARGGLEPPYLRFRLPRDGGLCRLWIRPAVVDPGLKRGEEWPARLLSPMRHDEAERAGADAQHRHLDGLLAEDWWRDDVSSVRVVQRRVPAEWGAQFHLYRDAMNPVMTARLMRRGRLPHRSPFVRGLYLAGSSTHPGQWVSFCSISGILAADLLREDLS